MQGSARVPNFNGTATGRTIVDPEDIYNTMTGKTSDEEPEDPFKHLVRNTARDFH